MKMRRALVLGLLLVLLAPVGCVSGGDYTGVSTSVRVYGDGNAYIDMVIEPDPTLPRLNVTLMGEAYLDMLVVDSEGVLLGWRLMGDGVEVDGLGVDQISISYTTPSLTNKTGSRWTATVHSETSPVVTLPEGAVLVGLNPAPLGISVVEETVVLSMPNGTSTISYLLGASGTREQALVTLTLVGERIQEARDMDLKVDEAVITLGMAQSAYGDAQYSLAIQYGEQAGEELDSIIQLAEEAMVKISQAEEVIAISGDTGEAQSYLDSAKSAYEEGLYQKAIDDSETAILSVTQVTQSSGVPLSIIAGGVAVVIVLGVLLLWNRGKHGGSPSPEVDLSLVFKAYPHLRTDDKAILRYLQESGGAFITQIRERFDIPKSSAWRMIKRLEGKNLIEAEQVGRETFLRLKSQEDEP